MRRLLAILLLIFTVFPLAACNLRPSDRGWLEMDLRWLGGPKGPTPATDIVAVYAHTSRLSVEIRVDMLDINPGDAYEFRLSLWDDRSFNQDPFEIDLASNGAMHARSQAPGAPTIWPRVIQNFELDTINISLNRFLLGSHYRMDLATYIPGDAAPVEVIHNVRSDGPAPRDRAPYYLAVWNTFPADTPAQALRRWDGAHTGPLGDRSGLKYLLNAAKQNNIPLVLLDVKKPSSLAALNYLDALGFIRTFSQKGEFLLPDAAYSQPVKMALRFSQRAARGFKLPVSPFVFNPGGADPADPALEGYAAQFVPLQDSAHMAAHAGKRLIPLPEANAVEATEDGPSLEVRRALLKVLLSPDRGDLVALGGSLPDSTWGQADMTAPTLRWLDAHPWARRLNAKALMAFPIENRNTAPVSSLPQAMQSNSLLDELEAAPANAITDLAWQQYLWLNEPGGAAELAALRANYLGQVSDLLEAARWAEKPSAEAHCGEDAAGDGQAACVLANESTFAILDPAGARLSNLFYRDDKDVHQLVGPSSQFAVGLSDPSEWKLEAGSGADPSVIPGAFADLDETWSEYEPSVTAGAITFTSAGEKRAKSFRLAAGGLEVSYRSASPVTTRIPLAVDPQAYYAGPVDYRPAVARDSWTWGVVGGVIVEVSSDADLSAQGFVASYPFLSMPEDPNLDYPAGHYLPFPLSLVTVQGEGTFTVKIAVK